MEEHMGEHDGMVEQQEVELPKIEESVLSIIAKIRKDRSRACIQNIHTFINRRGIHIDAEDVKKVTDNLISRNVIKDKGKEGKASLFIVDISPEDEEIINSAQTVNSGSEPESSFNALQEFIDERFYSTLINKIKSEIKLELNESLNHDSIQISIIKMK